MMPDRRLGDVACFVLRSARMQIQTPHGRPVARTRKPARPPRIGGRLRGPFYRRIGFPERSIVGIEAMTIKKNKSGAHEVFENGILVGWHAWTRDRVGEHVEAFIPRRLEDIEADRRNRTLH